MKTIRQGGGKVDSTGGIIPSTYSNRHQTGRAGVAGEVRGAAWEPSREKARPGHTLPLLPVLLRSALFLLLLLAGPAQQGGADEASRAQVELRGVVFNVEVADSPMQQRLGLGGRRGLGAAEGMLFLYAVRDFHSFWMKGMFIPIDIIWLDNRRVVHIEHGVPPPPPGTPVRRLPTYAPSSPANAVLEIAAGRATELGLRVGDMVRLDFSGG